MTARLLDFMFSSYDNAKNNQRMAAERLAMAKAKHMAHEPHKGPYFQ